MKHFLDKIISKINTEIETSCIDSDISPDKAIYMIDFIKPLFVFITIEQPKLIRNIRV